MQAPSLNPHIYRVRDKRYSRSRSSATACSVNAGTGRSKRDRGQLRNRRTANCSGRQLIARTGARRLVPQVLPPTVGVPDPKAFSVFYSLETLFPISLPILGWFLHCLLSQWTAATPSAMGLVARAQALDTAAANLANAQTPGIAPSESSSVVGASRAGCDGFSIRRRRRLRAPRRRPPELAAGRAGADRQRGHRKEPMLHGANTMGPTTRNSSLHRARSHRNQAGEPVLQRQESPLRFLRVGLGRRRRRGL